MITYNGQDITAILAFGRTITALSKGARVVWQAVNSCFGSGWWIAEKPWSHADAWKH